MITFAIVMVAVFAMKVAITVAAVLFCASVLGKQLQKAAG